MVAFWWPKGYVLLVPNLSHMLEMLLCAVLGCTDTVFSCSLPNSWNTICILGYELYNAKTLLPPSPIHALSYPALCCSLNTQFSLMTPCYSTCYTLFYKCSFQTQPANPIIPFYLNYQLRWSLCNCHHNIPYHTVIWVFFSHHTRSSRKVHVMCLFILHTHTQTHKHTLTNTSLALK